MTTKPHIRIIVNEYGVFSARITGTNRMMGKARRALRRAARRALRRAA